MKGEKTITEEVMKTRRQTQTLLRPKSHVEIKGQLDATDWFLLQNLLFAQHVSGTIMPIIRSSRFIQIVAAYGTWRFGLQVVGLVWSCGLCVKTDT